LARELQRSRKFHCGGQFGFEFSLAQIEVRAIELKPDLFDAYWAEVEAEERNKAA
jgi:hypothetical protein